jgi:type II secretory pathway component PulM
MELVTFPEQTVVIAKDQAEYLPLPAHRFVGDPQGRIAFCWRLNWRERLTVLWRGVLWHEVLTFNRPLQPQRLRIGKPEMTLAVVPKAGTELLPETKGAEYGERKAVG